MSRRELQVGDFVLTRRSLYSVNNGIKAGIIEVVPGRGIDGSLRPYTIARLDGLPFPKLGTRAEPAMRGLVSAYYLKRLDLGGTDSRDVLIGEPLLAEAGLYRWAEEEGIELQGSATLRYMRALGIPITRAKFLELNWKGVSP